jgi:hypothetical protein
MLRDARMPSPFVTGHKLRDVAGAVDDKMCGDGQPSQIFFEPRVGLEIKLVEKKIRNEGCAKLSGRQTDVVNDQ